MTKALTLHPAELLELELVLAGAWGAARFALPQGSSLGRLRVSDGVVQGDIVTLQDGEGTPLAQIDVETTLDSPEGTWVEGAVTQLRPFGHRAALGRRLTGEAASRRSGGAILVTGDLVDGAPAMTASDEDQPVIVLDFGRPRDTARNLKLALGRGASVAVLPAPDPRVRTRTEWVAAVTRAAQSFFDLDVVVRETERLRGEGCVVLLTGLSGSGKSTIAKALAERLSEEDAREITLLDGDEVRLVLSSGLGFSRADREMNVRRIGWVAALIAKHNGVAVCAPIAPYESMRREMRERAEEYGRFMLVHVSTPLEVCEARDRKGLYAKARRGEIPHFTGISDPYDVPLDADVVVDASKVSPQDAVDAILTALPR